MAVLICISYILVMLGVLGIYVRRSRWWLFGSVADVNEKWRHDGTYKCREDFFFTAIVTSVLWPISLPICILLSFLIWWIHLFVKND